MHNLYVKKDLAYQDLVKQSRSAMAELIAHMESTSLDNDSIARKMVELANALGSVKGKKQYGYLPKKLKELVDAITDELALQPDVAACYQVWNDLRDKLEGYYKDKPRSHNPLSKQKEFKAIKNSIIREADRLRLELEQEEMDSTNPYTNEESGEIDSTETPPKTDSAQQPTARWATPKEIRQTYKHVPFQVDEWRRGKNRPEAQGIVLGCIGRASVKAKKYSKHGGLKALVDCDDVHFLMIGASGVGKTAFFLYPNLEYACACGMSFLALDTKGDLARNYGAIASKYYGYKISVIDLRNPTRSDGNNLLTLINRYMDLAQEDPSNLAARAKAEKYAKILAKTIVNPDGDASSYGQNAFFYDAAEGLLTAVVLLLAEYLPPTKGDSSERRHIVSVSKLIQDLLESPGPRQKNYFQQLGLV